MQQIETANSKWECGEREVDDDEHSFRAKFRILNGTCAKYGAFPWVAQIQRREVAALVGAIQHLFGCNPRTPNWVQSSARITDWIANPRINAEFVLSTNHG